jgi:hypothetical protein
MSVEKRPDEAGPPDLYAARITGSRETIVRLMQSFDLDVGCRPHPEVNPDGSVTLLAYADEERMSRLRAAGYRVERGENVSAVGRQRQAEVGVGDRFMGGRIAPRGLGKKTGYSRRRGSAS